MWIGVIFLIAFVLLLNIVISIFHLSEYTVIAPEIYLRHQNRRVLNSSAAQQYLGTRLKPPKVKEDDGDWLKRLYLALKNEILLTRNVKSKEHLWKNIQLSPHFNQESGEILVYLGWVAYWDMELYALHGGPSGEFVIFADLITGLAALGYNLTIIHTMCEFWEALSPPQIDYDFIITDYDGLGTAENIGHFPHHHCKYFIVDGFGTQQEFNKRNLDLKRVLTPYPFDGTNTPIHLITDQLPRNQWSPQRKKQAVIWAKSYQYLSHKLPILRQLSKSIPLVGTFGEIARLQDNPNFITQLPFLNRTSFLHLLSSSMFLIGVGAPLDGPTALEAIAHGCIYLNPQFNPPIQSENKPNRFLYTSQHPFAERHIPPPHTYTINLENPQAVQSLLLQILSQNKTIEPFIHPFHTPLNFIQNLRHIFSPSSSIRSQCEQNLTNSRPSPNRHPNNKFYSSFLQFLQQNCGSNCNPHWTQIDPSAVPSMSFNSTSCITRFMKQLSDQGVPYEIHGDSLFVVPISANK